MALILVVEPDARRAADVTSLARTVVRAEVTTVGSAARACAALGDLLPDVVLLSPLLSAHDEASIAGALRARGPAGTHVQLLTIPVIAAQRKAAAPAPAEPAVKTAARRSPAPAPEPAPRPASAPAPAPRPAPRREQAEADEDDESEWVPLSLDDICRDDEPARDAPRVVAPAIPVQDEWGFFDPEQCGFAALVATLDEVAGQVDVDQHTPRTTTRLIAY